MLKRMDRDATTVIKDANEAVFLRVADFVQTHVISAPKVLPFHFAHLDANALGARLGIGGKRENGREETGQGRIYVMPLEDKSFKH